MNELVFATSTSSDLVYGWRNILLCCFVGYVLVDDWPFIRSESNPTRVDTDF